MQRLWIGFIAVLLSACATTPAPLRGEYSDLTPEMVQSSASPQTGEEVRWGGIIAEVVPGKEQTCLTVLSRPLDSSGRPMEGDQTMGRFLACSKGFVDPAVYAPQREITVVGTVEGTEVRKIGEYPYRYPKVAVSTIYLWPKREKYRPVYLPPYYPYYDPFYGPFYRPYCGTLGYPWRCSPYWW
jgi:outer membrane lipoprotein